MKSSTAISVSGFLLATTAFLAAGCSGLQSALEPAGRDAERIADIFLWMTIGAVIIWAAVVALAVYAPRSRYGQTHRTNQALVIGGGVLFPSTVLSGLLAFGLAEMPGLLAPGPDDRIALEITGAQWWWRVRYVLPGRQPIELANEIRLPVGRRINVRLFSSDVVHSFWIPSVAGKLDMIPGRITRMSLEPTRTGMFRGACAEFCGTSHAFMNLIVVVMEPPDFEAWLDRQARPASTPADAIAGRGQQSFVERGCSACHTIRGTVAVGSTGPDLTHVGSRQTIAAGLLPTRPEELRRWIAGTERLKPGVHMPAFAQIPGDELAALSEYLAQLQ